VLVGPVNNKPKNNSKQNFTNTLELKIKHLEIEWNWGKKKKNYLKFRIEKSSSSPTHAQSKRRERHI
jgi:hypothetical protein